MEDQKAIQRQPQVATSAVVRDEPAKCAECGRNLPGHRIDCKTGNDRAKAYQDKLERRYRARRSHTTKLMDADLKTLELAQDAPRRSMQRLVRHLDLFSGIGGFALAAQWVGGIETVAFCEIDPWARRVLAKNFPGVPINENVKTLNPQDYGRIDLITGGYPCQPFSVAGQRKGANDDRHLWPQVFRILQQARPRWMLCENVAGHIDLGLDEVLSDLASASYTAEAIVVPACALNAIHRRDRVWIIAHADSERGDELLPERVLEEYHASRKIQSGGGRFSETWGHSTRETASRILRTDDGVSAGVDRNRGLGNAIVPQVAAEILRAMMAVDCMSNA